MRSCVPARGRRIAFIEVAPEWTTALRCRETGEPFVAVGLNYFGPHVGWAPKLWQQFDAADVRKHLTLVRDQGFNTIRVFLTLDSFHQQPGEVRAEGVAKFRELLGDLSRAGDSRDSVRARSLGRSPRLA